MKVNSSSERTMKGIERHLNRFSPLNRSPPGQASVTTSRLACLNRHRANSTERNGKRGANQCLQPTVKMLRISPSAEGHRWAVHFTWR
jgi:hypothetical protein